MTGNATGKLFVFAAPSGAGKTTLVHAVVTRRPELRFSISYTTRKPRRNEANGVDYLFVDEKEFFRLRDEGELLALATTIWYPSHTQPVRRPAVASRLLRYTGWVDKV